MKAGTTWLYEQLKEDTKIYFTPRMVRVYKNKIRITNFGNERKRYLA